MADTKGLTVKRAAEVQFQPAQGAGATGLSLARLYQPPDHAMTFQLARIDPGGISRRHAHPWEQINWVANGTGLVDAGGQQTVIAAGDCVIFPGGLEHQITNTGSEPLLLVALLGRGAP